ncbi:MAG: discoidin domain-containing protein, partial [Cellulomonadaceae bacterium]
MTALYPPAAAPRRRFGRAVAFSLAAALAGSTAVAAVATAAPASAADSEFVNSFEDNQAAPLPTPLGESTNLTGNRFEPGSLLAQLVESSASSQNPPNETVDKLADANPSTKWLAPSTTGWAMYRFAEPVSFDSYTLTSGNDAPERDPRDFTIEGSNNGSTWTVIDTRTNESFASRGLTKTYELDAPSAEYTQIRMRITRVDGTQNLQLAGWELFDSASSGTVVPGPLDLKVNNGPTSSYVAKTGVGFTGTKALQYAGRHIADGPASATSTLFAGVDIAVEADSQLSYKVFPVLDSEQTYAATFVAVDLVFAGGETLSASHATDVYGYEADAASQGSANVLWPDQWNSITVDLGQFAGETVTDIRFTYDHPDTGIKNIETPTDATSFTGWLDDVTIDKAVPREITDGLVSYVDTRRGTNSNGGFSRGNNIPAVAWPNGFNFITPMTNADNVGTVYHYQRENNSANLPGLNGIGFSHQPSIWMGDRNQLAVLPAANDNPTSSLGERRLTFQHKNEVARPDIYSVTFEDGLATAVTPTDHGAIYQFDFTGDTGSVLVDRLNGESELQVAAD